MSGGASRVLDAHLADYEREGRACIEALPKVAGVLKAPLFSEVNFVSEELVRGPSGQPLQVKLAYDVRMMFGGSRSPRQVLLDSRLVSTPNIIPSRRPEAPADPLQLNIGFFGNRVALTLNLRK